MRRPSLRRLAAGLVGASLCTSLHAQIPPHEPGTICVTATFWCWAVYKGPPGTRCSCPTPQGWISGTLR